MSGRLEERSLSRSSGCNGAVLHLSSLEGEGELCLFLAASIEDEDGDFEAPGGSTDGVVVSVGIVC